MGLCVCGFVILDNLLHLFESMLMLMRKKQTIWIYLYICISGKISRNNYGMMFMSDVKNNEFNRIEIVKKNKWQTTVYPISPDYHKTKRQNESKQMV